jgi:hypothetical protein
MMLRDLAKKFTRLHCVLPKKTVIFIVTAMKTSNPPKKTIMKITGCWDVMPCRPVHVYRRCARIFSVLSSETSVNICHTTRHHVREDHNFHMYRCGNLSSVKITMYRTGLFHCCTDGAS